MTDSTNNHGDFDLQQIINKVKAMITPEKRAEMLGKVKAMWASFNEKPAESVANLAAKPAVKDSVIASDPIVAKPDAETRPEVVENTAIKTPEAVEKNKL